MKENALKAVITAGLAAFAAYFGELLIPLTVLFAVMILDYATGMAKAWCNAELSSRVGIKGIIKKIGYLVIVAAAMGIDWLIQAGLPQLGLNLPCAFVVALLAIVWLIINELISILENVAEIGAPSIPLLSKLLEHIKKAVEQQATTVGGEENDE